MTAVQTQQTTWRIRRDDGEVMEAGLTEEEGIAHFKAYDASEYVLYPWSELWVESDGHHHFRINEMPLDAPVPAREFQLSSYGYKVTGPMPNPVEFVPWEG